MKKILSFCLLTFIMFSSLVRADNRLDIITYADFSHIRDITASINTVYFATTEGVTRYDLFSESWLDPIPAKVGVDTRSIFKIGVDQFDRKLYARTEINSYEYDLGFGDWFSINEIPSYENYTVDAGLSSIMYVPQGYIFSNDGYIIDKVGVEFPISRVVKDGSGRKWVGIWGIGAGKIDIGNSIELLPYGLIQNRVNAIYLKDDEIIVGGDNLGSSRTGLTFFDLENNSFSYKESGVQYDFPDDDVTSIEKDKDYLYVGTIGGVVILNNGTHNVVKKLTDRDGLFANEVTSLKMYNEKLYIGSLYGLQVYNTVNDSLKSVYAGQLFNQEVYDLELVGSTLWIASSIGAFQLNLKTNEMKKFQDPHNIVNNRVLNIESADNKIYIASQIGMVRLNLKNGETTQYLSDSFGNNQRALAVNDKIACIATDLGFEMFYLTKDGSSNSREFTPSDGLPSQYVYDLQFDGDYIWIGSDRGLSLFLWNDPNRID